jgi:hypothetical protein
MQEPQNIPAPPAVIMAIFTRLLPSTIGEKHGESA